MLPIKISRSEITLINAFQCTLTFTSHMVQVVSMEQVPTMEGSVSFQSKQVRGAQYSMWGWSEK